MLQPLHNMLNAAETAFCLKTRPGLAITPTSYLLFVSNQCSPHFKPNQTSKRNPPHPPKTNLDKRNISQMPFATPSSSSHLALHIPPSPHHASVFPASEASVSGLVPAAPTFLPPPNLLIRPARPRHLSCHHACAYSYGDAHSHAWQHRPSGRRLCHRRHRKLHQGNRLLCVQPSWLRHRAQAVHRFLYILQNCYCTCCVRPSRNAPLCLQRGRPPRPGYSGKLSPS